MLSKTVEVFRERIIEWYSVYGDYWLPWRLRSNAWSVLLASVLLRNTTVKQVLRVYSTLIEKYPSPTLWQLLESRRLKS